MKLYAILVIALACIAVPAWGKTFTKCSLAKTLYAHGIPKSELPDWVCLVQHESGFRTNARGTLNKNGTRDFGLFQINNQYWCQGNVKSANECKTSCEALLSDDITKALNCAKKIKKQQGFKAWYGWLNNCQKSKPSVKECF